MENAALRPSPPLPGSSSARSAVGRGKRLKLRARENARLQCQNLELDIMNLHQEIATLTTMRRLLYARELNRPEHDAGSLKQIVREFYVLSADGYYEVVWRTNSRHQPAEPVDMVQFMRTSFDSTLAVGAGAARTEGGLDGFLGVIGQMTVVLGAPRAELLEARILQGRERHHVVVAAKSRCTCSLTAILLDKVFPHLQLVAPVLRSKLIGQQISTISEGDFTFHTKTRRIVRVDLRSDYTPAILGLAETMEELQLLTGQCAVEEVCSFGEAPDEQQEPSSAPDEPTHGPEEERVTGKISPMSLQHVLSPEDDLDDDEQHYARVA